MNRSTSHRQPAIHSPGTHRLIAHVRAIRRREPNVDNTVDAIRSGDDRALDGLISRAQKADADAAVIAIWALLPRLAAVVINRVPISEWQQTMDDYLSFTYLTLVDVDLAATREHLSDKVIARTRRRVERSMEGQPPALCQPDTIAALAPCGNDVEERAIARAELATLLRAVDAGLVDSGSWRTLLDLRFSTEPGTASARQRKVASRARIRLQEWAGRAA